MLGVPAGAGGFHIKAAGLELGRRYFAAKTNANFSENPRRHGLPAPDLAAAVAASDVCVTCTPSRAAVLLREHVRPGTFVAAVGADSADKQELEPQLLADAVLVVDVLEQCAEIGELHHALAAGLLTREAVHAELADVVTGRRPGRQSEREITLFDSTGTALEDVAAAAVVCERAVASGQGVRLSLAG